MRRALLLLTCLAPHARADQSMVEPAVQSFEAWSPLADRPVGPIAPERARALLGRWLEVHGTGAEREIVFQPEGRVRWHLWYGAHGLERKVTLVDGATWTDSRFSYDGAGRLARKQVIGPGAAAGLEWRYLLDERGRILVRAPEHGSDEVWRVTWNGDGSAVAETLRTSGASVRRDEYDPAGRLTATRFGAPGGRWAGMVWLRYRRDASGRLREVRRTLPGATARDAPAAIDRRDPAVTADAVEVVANASPERWEARLALGPPASSADEKRGRERAIKEGYAEGCWLNRTSTLVYDAAERERSGEAGCVCGFCVDARAEVAPVGALEGEQTHWTAGPWVRLDEALDLTAEHEVLTPDGPRPAGDLRPGDLVLDARGRPRPLRAARRLPDGPERLGRNLATSSGTFTAGDFTLASERPRACR